MSIVGAIIAGLIGSIVVSIMLAIAPQMGLPKMDFVGILAAWVGVPRARIVGFVLHLLIGVVWAFIYAALWSAGIGSPDVTIGALFGIVHWLIAGALFGLFSFLRPGVPDSGSPGLYLRNLGGSLGFFGGLMVHVIYGLTVALVYEFIHP